jgi:hypothetical protein
MNLRKSFSHDTVKLLEENIEKFTGYWLRKRFLGNDPNSTVSKNKYKPMGFHQTTKKFWYD